MPHLPPPSAADDLFLHQIVAPHGAVGTTQAWGERSFFSIPLGDAAILELGLRAYPHRGTIEGYVVARHGDHQWNLRTGAAIQFDQLQNLSAGPIRTSVLEPQKRWALAIEAPDAGLEAEIEFVARTSPFYCDEFRVERDGEVLAHNLTFFQSGRYTGSARIGGEEFALDGMAGARDRSWGHRKRESSPSRGLMSWIAIERADGAVIAWVYEKGDGTRTYTHGAWLGEDGQITHVEDVEHDYEFSPDSGMLERGHVVIDGTAIDFEVGTWVHMAGAGHVEGPGKSGTLEPGEVLSDRWLVAPAAEARRLRTVDDHLARFTIGDETAHGIVEVSRGAHAKYGDPPVPAT